jgi:chromosomal replication initiation ATPase DnaA
MTIHEIISNQRAAVMRLRALRENRKPMPTKTKPVIVKIVKQEPAAPITVTRLAPGSMVTLKRCIGVVSARYGIFEHLLLQDDRRTEVVRARWILFYVVKTLKKWSYPEIGRRLGNRDHSTVLNGCRKTIDRMQKNSAFKAEVEGVINEVLGR